MRLVRLLFGLSAKRLRLLLILPTLNAVLLLGCAHSKKTSDEAPAKKEWNNVHFGPATYNSNAHDFEDPWPFGPGP
jgi:hypothetical protein